MLECCNTPALRGLPVLFALLLITGCGGGGADSSTDDDNAPYALVFDSVGSDGQARLYRSGLNDAAPHILWGGVRGTRPAADPAGRVLVYARTDPSDPLSAPVLHQLDLNSGKEQRLSPDFSAVEAEPSFAPDGQRLAFTSQGEDSGGDIIVARWDGTGLSQRNNLTRAAAADALADRTPAWSPDGRSIAFTAYHGGGPAIWVMATDGSGARRLTATGNWGDFSPSWSADGHTIAFQRSDRGDDGSLRTRLGLISATGGAPQFLSLPYNAYDPRFSPDGRWLAFGAKTEDGGDICIATPDGKPLHCLGTPGVDRHPAWLRRP